jgi:hypothetical protein
MKTKGAVRGLFGENSQPRAQMPNSHSYCNHNCLSLVYTKNTRHVKLQSIIFFEMLHMSRKNQKHHAT